jgi:AcrR family transcriptional regulator
MANGKADRRTERTEQALMRAFIDLVLSRGYNNVTVEDIAERADVGRSTFYMHHGNKESLLRKSLSRPSTPLALLVGHDVPVEILVHTLAHFHDQRAINHLFFADPIRRIWIDALAHMIEPRLATVARLARANPLLPQNLIALEIAESQIGLVTNWLIARPALKPPVVAEAMIATTRSLTAALLRVPLEKLPYIPGEKLRVVHTTPHATVARN